MSIFEGYTVFGNKAAVYLKLDQTKSSKPTLGLDSAFRLPGPHPRYDWENKSYQQLTPRELPLFTQVLLGLSPSCAFEHRGQSGKSIALEKQSDHLFLRLSESQSASKQHMVRIEKIDLFYLSGLALKTCCKLIGADTATTLVALKSSI